MNHTDIDYYECLAKLILEYYFPEEFKCLEFSDKPDLYENNIGIEVTNASPQKYMEIEALAGKYWSRKIKDIKAVKDKIGEKYSNQIDYGIVSYPSFDANFDNIFDSIQDKLEKLNKDYKRFETYCLFIYFITRATDNMLSQALERIIEIQKNIKKSFL